MEKLKKVRDSLKEHFTGDPDENPWFLRYCCVPYYLPTILYDIWSEDRGEFWKLDFPFFFRVLVILVMILTLHLWLGPALIAGLIACLYQEYHSFKMREFREDDVEDPLDDDYYS